MSKSVAVLLAFCVSTVAAAGTTEHRSHAAPAPSIVDVPPAGATLPMRDFGGRPVVEVRINGKGPFDFILDTGATITVVDEKLAEELALSAEEGVRADSGGGPAPTIVTVKTLKVAGATIGGFLAAVMPLSNLLNTDGAPRGVLSALNFPGCLVGFDYPEKLITIKKGALAAADFRTIFDYPEDAALPSLPIRIAGQETRVHVDTGSATTLTLPRRFLSELPLKSQPKEAGTARALGGSSPIFSAAVDGALEIGSFKVELAEVSFSDMRLGGEIAPGNLGYGVLKDFAVTLDSKNRLVQLGPRSTPDERAPQLPTKGETGRTK